MSYRALVTSPLRGPVRGSTALGDGTGDGSARSPTAHVSSAFIFPSTASAGKQQSAPEPTVTVQQTWVHLRRDATQSIATGAGAGVNWDTQVAFPQAEGEALYASLPTDTLTAPFDGMLFYTFGSRWDAGATPGTNVQPELNGTVFDTSRTYLTPTAAVETWQPETEFFPVSDGDTVRWVISHDQGSAQTLLRADLWVLLIADAASVVASPVDNAPTPVMWAYEHDGGLQWDRVFEIDTDNLDTVIRQQDVTWGGAGLTGVGGAADVIWACDGSNGIREVSPVDFTTVRSVPAITNQDVGIGGTADVIWFAGRGTIGTPDPDGIRELSTADFSTIRWVNPGLDDMGIGGDEDAIWYVSTAPDTVYEVSTVDLSFIRSDANPLGGSFRGAGGTASRIFVVQKGGGLGATGLRAILAPADFSVVSQSTKTEGDNPAGIGGT